MKLIIFIIIVFYPKTAPFHSTAIASLATDVEKKSSQLENAIHELGDLYQETLEQSEIQIDDRIIDGVNHLELASSKAVFISTYVGKV